MNKKIKIDPATARKALLKSVLVLYSLMILGLLYGVAFSVASALRYSHSYRILPAGEGQEIIRSSAENDLGAQRAFLEARTGLVEADSVSLTVNLADSMITIEQKGVILHSASISGIKVSRVFSRIKQEDLSEFLNGPLTINESFSTIARKRYNMKVAPSDTSTYVPMVTPDTASRETVCYRFGLDRGIQLEFRQTEIPQDNLLKKFRRSINRSESQRILKDLLAFRVPDYHPVILIELSEKDARSIYKALPEHARVALRI